MKPDLTRSGDCFDCGVPVSLHFDRNRKLSCEVAVRRFQQGQLETPHDEPRRQDVPGRASHSFFERRHRGLFQV